MADLAHVLLPDLEAVKLPRFAQRTPEWLQKQRSSWLERQVQQAYCSLTPAACEAKPLKHIADLIVDRDGTQDAQVIHLFCSLTRSVEADTTAGTACPSLLHARLTSLC